MNGAVIFDIDGVLVDSYQGHLQSWRVLYAELGWELSDEEFAASFGRTTREILQARWPPAEPLDDRRLLELNVLKESHYRQIVANDFPVMPGAVQLIRTLHESGLRLAVGSSGPIENVELSLAHVDPDRIVEVAVSGNDVDRGKPDPQVFQLAANRLQIAPSCCLVVEDAPAGVEAAHRAGMKCIGVVSRGRNLAELSSADHCVGRLAEISVELVRNLIGERR